MVYVNVQIIFLWVGYKIFCIKASVSYESAEIDCFQPRADVNCEEGNNWNLNSCHIS